MEQKATYMQPVRRVLQSGLKPGVVTHPVSPARWGSEAEAQVRPSLGKRAKQSRNLKGAEDVAQRPWVQLPVPKTKTSQRSHLKNCGLPLD